MPSDVLAYTKRATPTTQHANITKGDMQIISYSPDKRKEELL